MTKSAKLLLIFLFVGAAIQIFGVEGQVDGPFLDKSFTRLSASTILANEFTQMDVTIGNPMNETTYVNVTVFASGIDCFPTNNSFMLLTPCLPNGSATTKTTLLILTAKTSGTFPINVQLWWNNTEVDSQVFVLNVYSALDPNMWGFWIRVNILVWGLTIMLAATQLLNPTWKLTTYDEKTKKTTEHSKTVLFLLLTACLLIAGYFFSVNYDNYYSFLPFLVRVQGRIEPLLAAGWILGAMSIGFLAFKRYGMSTSLSRLLLIMLLLLFVLDWVAFPTPPFFGWETLGIVFFSVVLNVLLEIGVKGLIEGIRRRVRRTQ